MLDGRPGQLSVHYKELCGKSNKPISEFSLSVEWTFLLERDVDVFSPLLHQWILSYSFNGISKSHFKLDYTFFWADFNSSRDYMLKGEWIGAVNVCFNFLYRI